MSSSLNDGNAKEITVCMIRSLCNGYVVLGIGDTGLWIICQSHVSSVLGHRKCLHGFSVGCYNCRQCGSHHVRVCSTSNKGTKTVVPLGSAGL